MNPSTFFKDHIANKKLPSDMPLHVRCFTRSKYLYDFNFVLWLNLLGKGFVAIIAVANIVIFICCYMISSYSILSKDFPTVTETFIEYCRKYPFCTCCFFHTKGKIAKEKPVNAPSAVVVKHKYFNIWTLKTML